MATFNQCQFIGRLGKDPEQTVIKGKPVTKFSLAVDQGKNAEAMWLNITCWDKLAETVNMYARKGMQVFLQGKLQVRSYTKNNIKQVSVEIIATTVQLLEKRQKDVPDSDEEPL